jgi:hypothetical protein
MKTFIFSYIASVMVIIYASFPAVQAAPLDVIPRIAIYFGLPSAVALSMVIITLSHALRLTGRSFDPGMLHAGESVVLNPEAKAA